MDSSAPSRPATTHAGGTIPGVRPISRRRPPETANDPVPAAGPAPKGVEPGAERLARLLVRKGGRLVVVRLDEVDWIEGAGNYVRLHVGTASFLHRRTMTALAERLDPERFVRIHRSTIVQIDRIEELRPTPSGTYSVRLQGGATLSLSRTHRRRVLRVAGRG